MATKNLYSNSFIFNLVNTYLRVVMRRDTGEVFVRYGALKDSRYSYVYWEDGKIIVSTTDHCLIEFNVLPVNDKNKIISNIIDAMEMDCQAIINGKNN